jgi:hypothetical protein
MKRPTIEDLRKVTHEKDPVCDHGGYTTVTRLDLLAALGLVIECEECGGEGFQVEERIRSVAEHHPNCNQDYTCESSCPIEVPVQEFGRVACPFCLGLGWQVAPEVLELVYQSNPAAGRENAEQLLRQVFEGEK